MKAVRRWFASTVKRLGESRYVALNQKIMECASAKEIETLMMANNEMNQINLATAYRLVSKYESTNPLVYSKLEDVSRQLDLPSRPLSSILHSITTGKWFKEIPPVFVQKATEANMGEFTPHEISSTVMSFAKMNCKEETVFEKVGVEMETRDLHTFGPQDVANILWAFGEVDYTRDAMFDRVAQHLQTRDLSQVTLQHITNITCVFANSGYKDFALFEKLAMEFETRDLRKFELQGFSKVVWAFATAGYQRNALLSCFVKTLLARNISGATPQAIVNFVCAFAKLEYKNDALLDRFAQLLMAKDLSILTPRELANVCWAFAKLGSKHGDALFQHLGVEVAKRDLHVFELDSISDICWAFNTLRCKHNVMFAHIAQDLVARDLSKATPQDCISILGLCALLRVNAPEMFQSIPHKSWTLQALGWKTLHLQALADLLHSCVVVNYRNDVLLNELARELASREGLSLEETVNAMWAFACLDSLGLEQVKLWFSKPDTIDFHQKHEGKFDIAQQLFHVKLAWEQTQGEPFPALIDGLCKGKWFDAALFAANQQKPIISSHWHLRVVEMLQERFTLQTQAIVLGGILVDILIPAHNAVVEVNRPWHFFSNEREVRTGPTVFKHRLLERAGYKVFSVPMKQFKKADGEQYVKDLEERIRK